MARMKLKPIAAGLALAFGVLTPAPAHSGPVVVAVAAAGASHYVGTVLAMGWLAGALAAVGTSMVLGGMIAKPGRQQEQPTFQAEMRDRLHVVRSAVETRRIVYGQQMVSGPLLYAQTTGSRNEYLHLVIALAGHECQEIGDIYLNDELIGDLDVDGNVVNGRFALDNYYVRVKKHLGAADQVADATLVSESGGTWTTAHRLRGIAYVYIRLIWSANIFPNGIPNIKCVVKGKKLQDPRMSPSVAYSNNWALVLRDYLTSSYGLGCNASELNDAVTATSANICDEQVALDDPPTTYQSRYTCNGTINLADRPVDIIRQLCTAAAGAAVFSQGVWRILPGAYVTPTVDVDESWLAGPVRVLPRKPRRELYNGVRGTHSNRDKFWQPTDFPPVDNSTYVTQDGGEAIWRDIELPFTDHYIRAQRIAKIHLEKSRQSAAVELPCNLKAFQVAVWDTVRLSLDRLGYDQKVFQVLSWRFDPAGRVLLKVQEEASAVYDWAAGDATEVDPAPDTTLPDPFTGLDITLGTPTSGTAQIFVAGDGTVVPRIRLPFSTPANPFVSYYRAQFARAAGSPQDWQPAPDVPGDETQAFFYPVEDGVSYDMRLQAVTALGNAGVWAYARGHTVIGKTELPSDVDGFSAVQTGGVVVMGCDSVADADLDLIEIRLHDEGETDFDNATPIGNILRGQTVTSAAISPGTWELLAKARDTSGNYSASAARVTITVTAEGFTTIESEAQALDWLGAKVNLVEHWTGVLYPDSTLAANQHTNAELFEQFVPYPYADCYYEAPVIDKGIDATARIYGDIVSVLGRGVTTGVAAPSLQVDHRTASGSFDGFQPWTVGSANFRYLKARIHVDTSIGKPVISQFTPTVDALARTVTGTLTVGGGGSGAVAFATAFHTTPLLQVTPQGSGDVTASYANLSTTGFDGYFKSGGAAAAGTLSYAATGP